MVTAEVWQVHCLSNCLQHWLWQQGLHSLCRLTTITFAFITHAFHYMGVPVKTIPRTPSVYPRPPIMVEMPHGVDFPVVFNTTQVQVPDDFAMQVDMDS